MGDAIPPQERPGCGLFSLVFGRRNIRPPRGSTSATVKTTSDSPKARKQPENVVERPVKRHAKSPQIYQHTPASHKLHQGQFRNPAAKTTPRAGLGLSGELDIMITDYQRSKGNNLAVFGNLGNLKPAGNSGGGGRYATSVMGNVVKKNQEPEKPVSLCRALSTRMDPEELKIMGNEDYRNGRFAEALSLYDAAISIDPHKASYRSNKSAALVAMGKLLEAAMECREAIRIDPFHQRAHNRLALIYVRLGEAERALHHFKEAGSDGDPDAMNRAKQVQIHLNKCSESKRRRDWNGVLKEAVLAVDAGADSAPSIIGLRAEALLKMNRHEEAIETMQKSPNFDIELCIRFFGPVGSSALLVFQAQVDIASGRFDDAIAAAQQAAKLDPNSKEAGMILKKSRAVAASRSNGNDLFKAARYSEACIAYGEGLSHDPHNALLLCNRAACKAKLGHFQEAVEDCNAALRVRPSYSKARLRRADSYLRSGQWGACVQDCEALLRESAADEVVVKMVEDARAQMKKHGADVASGLGLVSSNQHFRVF